MKVILNGHTVEIYQHDPKALRLPLPDGVGHYFMSPNITMGELAKLTGMVTYDYALPQSFFDAYMTRFAYAPRGVWCYDDKRILGYFVSLTQMLQMIADQIAPPDDASSYYFDEWGSKKYHHDRTLPGDDAR